MKSSKILRSFFIGCSLFAATALSAQTLVTSWEAEDFVGNGFRPDANNYPLATSATHSGGMYLQRVSQSQSVFYYVNVETAGVYDLKVYYMVKAKGGQIGNVISVRVNNQIIRGTQITEYTAEDTSLPTSIIFPVYLDAGVNLIRVGQNGAYIANSGYCPNIDYFELYTSTATLEKPAEDTNAFNGLNVFNMQYNDYTDFAEWVTLTTESANATVAQLIDNSAETKFVSTNAVEYVNLNFADGFILRRLVVDNPHVRVGKIERSLDGTTWSLWRGVNLFSSNNVSGVIEANNAVNDGGYKFYRVALHKPYWAAQLEVGEIQVHGIHRVNNTDIFNIADLTNADNGTVSTNIAADQIDGSNVVSRAIDDHFGNKFCVKPATFQIDYTFFNFAEVTAYGLANAAGPSDRDPKKWELSGSNDGTNYTSLHVVENFSFPTNQCQYMFKIPTPAIYKYYRLDVQQIGGTSYAHTGEFQLFGTLKTGLSTEISSEINKNTFVFASENQIVIKSDANLSYQIIDIAGKMLKEGTMQNSEISVPASKGIYMVKTMNGDLQTNVTKVVVR